MPEHLPAPQSVWWTDPSPSYRPFVGELDADVAIIGGGIAGLTLAYTLVEQGAMVGVFDSGPLGGAASGRNAGFMTACRAEPYTEQIALWGRLGARAMLEIGRRSHQRVSQLVETLGIACDYRKSGSVRLARSAEEAEDLRASLPHLAADGFPMREIPVTGAVPEAAAEHFSAAFLAPEDGELHPVRFLYGLARAAAERGARLFPYSPIRGACWRGGLWEAQTTNGIARARTLVIAANAQAPLLCPALAPFLRPRRGQMLATAPLPAQVIPRPTSAHWGYQYWRQTPDRRLVIGGWRDLDLDGEVGYDDLPTESIQRGIEQGLCDLVPGGAPIEYRWAGTMGFARDGRPLVGWLDAAHHLAICAGFTGHGMGMAAGCSLDLSDLLSFRRASGIASFDPRRFAGLRQERESIVALGAEQP